MKIRLKHLCLALVALMCLVLLSSCGSAPQPKQSVASMEDIGIKAQPKTAYTLGDPFDVSAGVLNLFYDDGTGDDVLRGDGGRRDAHHYGAQGERHHD